MAEPPLESPGDAYPGAPRWAKVLGVIALVFFLVFVVMHLTGRGMRHDRGSHSTEQVVPPR